MNAPETPAPAVGQAGNEGAQAKLAAIVAYCRQAVENASHIAYMPVDPASVRVSAGHILAMAGDAGAGS